MLCSPVSRLADVLRCKTTIGMTIVFNSLTYSSSHWIKCHDRLHPHRSMFRGCSNVDLQECGGTIPNQHYCSNRARRVAGIDIDVPTAASTSGTLRTGKGDIAD